MSITITIADEQGLTATLQVGAQDTVATLKTLIEAEMRIPATQQALLKDGQPLRSDDAPLSAAGVADGDMLLVVRRSLANGGGGGGGGGAAAGGEPRSLNDLPPQVLQDPQALMTALNANPRLLRELEHHNAELAALIKTGDVVKVRGCLMKQRMQAAAARLEQEQALRALEANPMDPEAQRKIEEMIQRENVTRNMEMAMEEMPEAFGQVVMLYIDAEVNGQPIKAFVDSGAQSTIMSAACAARCNLTRLIDTRFAGVAKGVGTSKILGRIHMYQLKVGDSFFPCTFTVLENDDVDFLFGLDMLKRHQCVIDLRRHVLQLGSAGKEVPFLAEKDLPMRARGHVMEEDPELKTAMEASAASAGASASASATATATAAAGGAGAASSAAATGAAASGGNGAGNGGGARPPVDENAVKALMDMGFTREQVVIALERTNGNADEAAGLLFAQFS